MAAVSGSDIRSASHTTGRRSYNDTSSISYKSYLRAMSCAIVNMLPFPWRAHRPSCVLLGRRYDFSDPIEHALFMADFSSRILLTYRYGFVPLLSCYDSDSNLVVRERRLTSILRTKMLSMASETTLTSDGGWGCMIRVFQMALAQVVVHLCFGREWRRPSNRHVISLGSAVTPPPGIEIHQSGGPSMPKKQRLSSRSDLVMSYIKAHAAESFNAQSIYPWNLVGVLSQFKDEPSARYSVHRIVNMARELFGLHPGEWLGPTSCAELISRLINGSHIPKVDDTGPVHNISEVNDEVSSTSGHRFGWLLPVTSFNSEGVGTSLAVGAYHSQDGQIDIASVRSLFAPMSSALPALERKRLSRAASEDVNQSSLQEASKDSPLTERSISLDSEHAASLPCYASEEDETVVNGQSTTECVTATYDAVVILLSLRLGLDFFNLRYQPFVQSCFGISQFQGLAGGGPLTSAYWFVAANDEHLYFLDPHVPVQAALATIDCDAEIELLSDGESSMTQYKAVACLKVNDRTVTKCEVDSMFFPSSPKQLFWKALNPSMTLVFLCRSALDFDDLMLKLKEVDTEDVLSPFHQPRVSNNLVVPNVEKAQEHDGFLVV